MQPMRRLLAAIAVASIPASAEAAAQQATPALVDVKRRIDSALVLFTRVRTEPERSAPAIAHLRGALALLPAGDTASVERWYMGAELARRISLDAARRPGAAAYAVVGSAIMRALLSMDNCDLVCGPADRRAMHSVAEAHRRLDSLWRVRPFGERPRIAP
jgi:hypothetical protein